MPNEPRGTRVLAAPDGRRLEVLAAGPEDGLPLLFHNGTPGGLVAVPGMVAEAAARGLRTVMYARPGYGESTGSQGAASRTRPPTPWRCWTASEPGSS
jgi:pimeloyl-ACP methyl ester carboxylesterase